jgi:hypothetical protein
MIELVPTQHDDPAFLSLAQRIVNGAIADLHVREVYVVHVDNWFDFKWLGWWSWSKAGLERLVVPPFNPNRVRGQKHFIRDVDGTQWTCIGSGMPLHVRRAGRSSLAQPIDRVSDAAAFVWYSGNTATNTAGSLMVYRSGTDGYAWYASFKNEDGWTINGEARVSRRELRSFEERGRQLELVCAHGAAIRSIKHEATRGVSTDLPCRK